MSHVDAKPQSCIKKSYCHGQEPTFYARLNLQALCQKDKDEKKKEEERNRWERKWRRNRYLGYIDSRLNTEWLLQCLVNNSLSGVPLDAVGEGHLNGRGHRIQTDGHLFFGWHIGIDDLPQKTPLCKDTDMDFLPHNTSFLCNSISQ